VLKDKRPSWQFYPGDWKKDPGIRALNFHDRGIWFEMLLLMFESERRGELIINGRPIKDETLGKILGIHLNSLKKTLRNLRDLDICGYDEKKGIYFSRRMIKDEHINQLRRRAGRLGGNPKFKKGTPNPYYQTDKHKDNQTDKQKITLSSSSSSSASASKDLKDLKPYIPGIPNPNITPKKDPNPHWPKLMAHIVTVAKKHKGVPIPINGKHAKALQNLSRYYQPWGVMALWDLWFERGNQWDEWAGKTGHSIEGFVTTIPRLLDNSTWKGRARVYESGMIKPLNRQEIPMDNILKTKV